MSVFMFYTRAKQRVSLEEAIETEWDGGLVGYLK